MSVPGPAMPTIDTRKRADQVRQSIIDHIRIAGLAPGAQLPTERELMEQLGVGRSTVREALNSLAGLGIVEARPGRGFFVSRASIEDVMRAVWGTLHLDSQVPWRLVEARSIIEVAASRLAAERHTPADIERLQAALEGIQEAFQTNDLDALVAADTAFHGAIVQASDNDVLLQMLRSIAPWMMQQRKELFQRRVEAGTQDYFRTVGTHQAILDAIISGDVDGAEREMREHLFSIWQQVKLWPLAAP